MGVKGWMMVTGVSDGNGGCCTYVGEGDGG